MKNLRQTILYEERRVGCVRVGGRVVRWGLGEISIKRDGLREVSGNVSW